MLWNAGREALSKALEAFSKRLLLSLSQTANFLIDLRCRIGKPSHMANQLDSVFSAMADPTRRAVIERLLDGPASVSDLHAPHGMAMPSFLKHIRKLEEAGLVTSQKTGRTRMIHIEAEPMRAAEDWLSRQRKLWEGRLDRLQAFAEALERTPQ